MWVYKILMSISNWTIRGLENLDKRANVRDFIYLYSFVMIAVQETKLISPSFHLLRSIWRARINEWVVLDSIGASRG